MFFSSGSGGAQTRSASTGPSSSGRSGGRDRGPSGRFATPRGARQFPTGCPSRRSSAACSEDDDGEQDAEDQEHDAEALPRRIFRSRSRPDPSTSYGLPSVFSRKSSSRDRPPFPVSSASVRPPASSAVDDGDRSTSSPSPKGCGWRRRPRGRVVARWRISSRISRMPAGSSRSSLVEDQDGRVAEERWAMPIRCRIPRE